MKSEICLCGVKYDIVWILFQNVCYTVTVPIFFMISISRFIIVLYKNILQASCRHTFDPFDIFIHHIPRSFESTNLFLFFSFCEIASPLCSNSSSIKMFIQSFENVIRTRFHDWMCRINDFPCPPCCLCNSIIIQIKKNRLMFVENITSMTLYK